MGAGSFQPLVCDLMNQTTQTAAKKMEDDRIPEWKLGYRVDEACAALGLGKTKLWENITTGKIEARQDGKAVIIPRWAMIAYLEKLPRVQGKPQ